ncbi:UDP-N-acetylmuramoyl-L-alanine--D-glutamate ligase [Agrilactobacillus fermenti]|uniref:UDP-N-acetylmuramoyl-L-alanine--D-glutamate ligase n=1 Tax=Agrilactobacillus fermenti TaxID=2586909 RepID=UPI001E542796|nr:UDP-N-acetylmuramoyl-L-alanine--D-glutamate ligase [Agrilactobacillus fermenti]MCD2255313.1 UDP-N-acetylmuramoyl-L-alanine--D-glutamate ligase [Agrilactobacillus fermenti]
MRKVTKYQNQKVLVLGLAKSGVHAAQLLHRLGALVTVNDKKPFDENPDAQTLLDEGIRVITGGHPLELLDEDFAWMVKNPGIPYDNPMVQKALARKIPIITEPELAYEVSEAPMIGVTGTNGKTTTTTLIALMLNEGQPKKRAYLAGNIGIPASEVAEKVTANDVMVTELSSFQLLGITSLKPHIAVLTNIYEAHLDYHKTRENYIKAKMHITKNQTAADYFVVNWDTEEWQNLARQSQATIVPFSRRDKNETGAYEKDGMLYFKTDKIMAAADIKIPGEHNVENALAAIAVAKIMAVPNEHIIRVLQTFTGVKHRMQYVEEWRGVRIYNDSKATNIEATEVALKSFKQPIVLIAGGLDRGFTFEALEPLLKAHVKAAVVYGETKQLMADALKHAGVKKIAIVDNLDEAVPEAFAQVRSGDILLLSPAAASWDQFHTFEERGDRFIEDVNQYIGSEQK